MVDDYARNANMSRYKAPDVKTFAVKISDLQARKLRALWNHAITTSDARQGE